MSAAIDTTSDVEILESLDFEPEKACEARRPACGREAVWLASCVACGHPSLWCTECRERFAAEAMARRLVFGSAAKVHCKFCGYVADFHELAVWTLLPKGGA